MKRLCAKKNLLSIPGPLDTQAKVVATEMPLGQGSWRHIWWCVYYIEKDTTVEKQVSHSSISVFFLQKEWVVYREVKYFRDEKKIRTHFIIIIFIFIILLYFSNFSSSFSCFQLWGLFFSCHIDLFSYFGISAIYLFYLFFLGLAAFFS